MRELLDRYTPEQQKVIADYWEVIRWTRQTGKISDGIKRTELEYWQRFEPGVVIRALEIHIDKAPNIREHYTRGIMRNLDTEKGTAIRKERSDVPAPQRKNRFVNNPQRDFDYEALEYLEMLKNAGELTEEKQYELKQNPRYAKYL